MTWGLSLDDGNKSPKCLDRAMFTSLLLTTVRKHWNWGDQLVYFERGLLCLVWSRNLAWAWGAKGISTLNSNLTIKMYISIMYLLMRVNNSGLVPDSKTHFSSVGYLWYYEILKNDKRLCHNTNGKQMFWFVFNSFHFLFWHFNTNSIHPH